MLQHHRSAALLFGALLAAACTIVPEYQPRTPGSAVGYTDVQLSPDRYRVTYSGSFSSNRDDVEMFLLRRAAEVTLQNGYTHFVVEKRETQRIPDDLGNPYPFGPLYYPYWGNAWYATAYSSYAEILLLKDNAAADAANAVDAQRVLVSLNALQPSVPVKTAAAPQ